MWISSGVTCPRSRTLELKSSKRVQKRKCIWRAVLSMRGYKTLNLPLALTHLNFLSCSCSSEGKCAKMTGLQLCKSFLRLSVTQLEWWVDVWHVNMQHADPVGFCKQVSHLVRAGIWVEIYHHSSKVSCFLGCWMVGRQSGMEPGTSGSDSAKITAWDVADGKDCAARTTLVFFHYSLIQLGFLFALTDAVLMTCLSSSEISMKSPYLQMRELRSILKLNLKFPCTQLHPLDLQLVWSCLNLWLYPMLRSLCWGPRACVSSVEGSNIV